MRIITVVPNGTNELKGGCIKSLNRLFLNSPTTKAVGCGMNRAPTTKAVGFGMIRAPTTKAVGSKFVTSIEPTASVVGAHTNIEVAIQLINL